VLWILSLTTILSRISYWACFESAAGHFSGRYIRPIIGFCFDLAGAIYRVDGCRFKIPAHLTDRNYRSAFVLDEYEKGERELIRSFIEADDRVIELGGCIGVLSCLVNSRLKSPVRHLVVEANPVLIPILNFHRRLNRAGFKIEHCGVSPHPEVSFAVHPLMTHGRVHVNGAQANGSEPPIRISGKSLKNLHEEHGPFTHC
jgi:hypothetical protein